MAATQDATTLDTELAVLTNGALRVVSPAVRALDAVQHAAIAERCSDIHFEPHGSGGRVRLRSDGALRQFDVFERELFVQMVSRVKILSGMDIAERRAPQDGRYSIDWSGRTVEARTSAMPTMEGEKLVVRLLDYDTQAPRLSELGMEPELLRRFSHCVHRPHGFVVVCGPTGSGKTTTLYAAISERDAAAQNLCSIEDPVEMRLPGIAQVQVNVRAGVTFASALRGFLRQDPNAVMVGELRDDETAVAAGTASLSGVLILATMHAQDAVSAITRLCELGVKRHTLAAGLSAIVSQRLGGPACGSRFGRRAVFEALFLDDTIRAQIAQGAPVSEIAAYARSTGYTPIPETLA